MPQFRNCVILNIIMKSGISVEFRLTKPAILINQYAFISKDNSRKSD